MDGFQNGCQKAKRQDVMRQERIWCTCILYSKRLHDAVSTRCVQRSYLWHHLQHFSAQHVNMLHITASVHGGHEIRRNIKGDGQATEKCFRPVTKVFLCVPKKRCSVNAWPVSGTVTVAQKSSQDTGLKLLSCKRRFLK